MFFFCEVSEGGVYY